MLSKWFSWKGSIKRKTYILRSILFNFIPALIANILIISGNINLHAYYEYQLLYQQTNNLNFKYLESTLMTNTIVTYVTGFVVILIFIPFMLSLDIRRLTNIGLPKKIVILRFLPYILVLNTTIFLPILLLSMVYFLLLVFVPADRFTQTKIKEPPIKER